VDEGELKELRYIIRLLRKLGETTPDMRLGDLCYGCREQLHDFLVEEAEVEANGTEN
jgi:PP-loop superfamily ATP-utilizing enzyme